MKFRKKPVVIEAVQYAMNEYADNPLRFKQEPPTWLKDAIEAGKIKPRFETEDYWYLFITTLEGEMRASPGDWIIQGVIGEIYPCNPEVFEDTYEAVEEGISLGL